MSSSQPAATMAAANACRVLVCDDSAVFRGVLKRALESDPEIAVPAVACNGQDAIAAVEKQSFDVVVLDIEMPVMDGLTALPKILAARPGIKVVIASTLTRRNAAISLQALERGASDYLTKPSATGYLQGEGEDFSSELIAKVRALVGRKPAAAAPRGQAAPVGKSRVPIALRPPMARRADVLAIGSSTGGPQALLKLLVGLKSDLARVPVLITQHMPPTFTQILAEHIARATGIVAREGVEGEVVGPGRIYVAPGDHHMEVVRQGSGFAIKLHQGPRENYCRPAVDPMLRSVAQCWGNAALVVILTGMNQDGLHGGRKIVESGGAILAQDEASSVVWGMPGAVAMAGICSAVIPIDQMADHVRRNLTGGRA
jgi:two-component system chemotaxis response regulator CheB